MGSPFRTQPRNFKRKYPEESVCATLDTEPTEAVTCTPEIGDRFLGSELRSSTAPCRNAGPVEQLSKHESVASIASVAGWIRTLHVLPLGRPLRLFDNLPVNFIGNLIIFPATPLCFRKTSLLESRVTHSYLKCYGMTDGPGKSKCFSRRTLLRGMLGATAAAPFSNFARAEAAKPDDQPLCGAGMPPPTKLSDADEAFLEELEKATFLYFVEQASSQTGLVKDRSKANAPDSTIVASIAATGFGLTAMCIGHKRGYISLDDARNRVLITLRSLWNKLPTHRGFFFHFANVNTGERMWESEISSVDTAILLCGMLTCRKYFEAHSEISRLAYDIFNRVDWSWVAEDTSLLSLGWAPEMGFLSYRWESYSELMMMYLLGLGSLKYPLPAEAWAAWKRTTFEYDGLRYIGSFAPLFIHQYSQAWFDFRNKRDRYADYFQNSIAATEAHRRFCVELGKRFSDYNEDLWGISASDSKTGYTVWGGPPAVGPIDGTVVPSAAAGSIPFLPQPAMRVLHNIKDHYPKAWSRYGFVNAFNPLKNWYDTDVIGIDTGITMLMAENARTGFVWKVFMKNLEAQRGMQRAGFKSYTPST